MKTHQLATHACISSNLSISFSAQGPQFETIAPTNRTPIPTLEAIENATDEQLNLATWLIRCDITKLNKSGYDGNKIASRYRVLQKKLKGDHLHAWQKAIEQVTGKSIASIRQSIENTP